METQSSVNLECGCVLQLQKEGPVAPARMSFSFIATTCTNHVDGETIDLMVKKALSKKTLTQEKPMLQCPTCKEFFGEEKFDRRNSNNEIFYQCPNGHENEVIKKHGKLTFKLVSYFKK